MNINGIFKNSYEMAASASSAQGEMNNGNNVRGIDFHRSAPKIDSSSRAQSQMGLVPRLDKYDEGSLNHPEQRDAERGKRLYVLQ